MSFKCRSSTSLSSNTVMSSHSGSITHLLPSKPEKAYGLGIYAPPQPMPSFLTPRPSLSSIRTYTTMHSLPPPSSTLPPLPAYFPDKFRKPSAMTKAVYPPKLPYRPSRTHSEKSVRIVPPSPALSIANLEAFNKSTMSVSSVYSRSISGENHSPRPGLLSDRSLSSESTATVVKSPLGAMRIASDPDTVIMTGLTSRKCSENWSDSDIDDVATLHATLPSVKAVSEFGDIGRWQLERDAHASHLERARGLDADGVVRRNNYAPLMVHKTRDIPSLASRKCLAGVA